MSDTATYKGFEDLLGRIQACIVRAKGHVVTAQVMAERMERANKAGHYTLLGYSVEKTLINRLRHEAHQNLAELREQQSDVIDILRRLG